MTFSFSLQKLLQVKEKERDEKQKHFEVSRKQFEEAGYRLYHLLRDREQMIVGVEGYATSGTTIAALQTAQMASERMEKEIVHVQGLANDARAKMNVQKDALHHATIELKKLEKLKVKQHETYRQEEKLFEQQQLDETATLLYIRQN
ncbi:flagellar export protein FliJ [Geomicrobium sediminis]|uniref:Flagellar FliJ protein n=1 Tax=Geomicrobium sediminis TaxID=1347788 RepID=A0ABS2PCS3_9BACL|nr:flagellar export protein FliJ [Geomicrobium sediminis]MBM7632593.1 flagellar FliJ protein [Geomicrobium sediminis]